MNKSQKCIKEFSYFLSNAENMEVDWKETIFNNGSPHQIAGYFIITHGNDALPHFLSLNMKKMSRKMKKAGHILQEIYKPV